MAMNPQLSGTPFIQLTAQGLSDASAASLNLVQASQNCDLASSAMAAGDSSAAASFALLASQEAAAATSLQNDILQMNHTINDSVAAAPDQSARDTITIHRDSIDAGKTVPVTGTLVDSVTGAVMATASGTVTLNATGTGSTTLIYSFDATGLVGHLLTSSVQFSDPINLPALQNQVTIVAAPAQTPTSPSVKNSVTPSVSDSKVPAAVTPTSSNLPSTGDTSEAPLMYLGFAALAGAAAFTYGQRRRVTASTLTGKIKKAK
jgi:LPXTG-motif cell wall-anchored protein